MNGRSVSMTAALAGALLLVAAACGGGGQAPAATAPAFYIAGTTPPSGAFGVSLDSTVVVRFNTTIAESTFDAGTLRVTRGEDVVEGTLDVGHGPGYDSLHWFPRLQLTPATLYTVRLSQTLRSSTDDALSGFSSFSFVTRSGDGTTGLPTRDQLRAALGHLNVGRQAHEATLLDDGRVLITGGFAVGNTTTDSAEVYDEASEHFVELEMTLGLGRASHTATKLEDGRVLLAGGWITLGGGDNATTATAEIFDPATGAFTPVGSMASERADHAAGLLPDGRVLITGGSRLVGNFLQDLESAEVFDPDAGQFSALLQPMTHTRATHGMVPNGLGQIVLAGGSDVDPRHGWYDVASGVFEDLGVGANDRGRFGPAAAAFASGAVVVAGGDVLGTVMVVTSSGLVLNSGSGLDRPRSYATAVRIKPDQILVAGGIDFSSGGFIQASCDVIVEGGLGGANTYAAEVRLGTGMVHHTATVLAGGDILFCGGLSEDGALPNKEAAYLFDVR